MKPRAAILATLAILGGVTAGWALGTWTWSASLAHAEEPVDVTLDSSMDGTTTQAPAGPFRLRCRTFEVELGQAMDLPGSDSEAGRWVQEQTGYSIWTVDYEAVQKSNGYPQHVLQVCVTPQ